MAPKIQKLHVEGINIRKKVPYIKDINELIAIRDRYFNWYADVHELVKDTKFVAKFARIDNAVSDFFHNGGAGVNTKWDERSLYVMELIKSSLDNILDFIESIQIPDKANYKHSDKKLYLGDIGIFITNRAQSRESELLRVLFSDKYKNWPQDEIIEELKSSNFRPKEEDRKDYPKNAFYHAGKSINKKVAQAFQVSDLLLVTTKDIQINPDYL